MFLERYVSYSQLQIVTSFMGQASSAKIMYDYAGSAKANGREPKSGLGRVFNFKLDSFD